MGSLDVGNVVVVGGRSRPGANLLRANTLTILDVCVLMLHYLVGFSRFSLARIVRDGSWQKTGVSLYYLQLIRLLTPSSAPEYVQNAEYNRIALTAV